MEGLYTAPNDFNRFRASLNHVLLREEVGEVSRALPRTLREC